MFVFCLCCFQCLSSVAILILFPFEEFKIDRFSSVLNLMNPMCVEEIQNTAFFNLCYSNFEVGDNEELFNSLQFLHFSPYKQSLITAFLKHYIDRIFLKIFALILRSTPPLNKHYPYAIL